MIMNDELILKFFRSQLHPLLAYLYLEARVEVPEEFDHKVEGPRLIAALRAQGFATKFNCKTSSREKL